MKTLVVYYSRTGHTEKAAEAAAEELRADMEAIIDLESRKGLTGYLKSGYQAAKRIPSKIAQMKKDPAQYDLVVVCTPVWAGQMSCAVRAFLSEYGSCIKSAAYILTKQSKSNDYAGVFEEMDKLIGKLRVDAVSITSKDEGSIVVNAQAFAKGLKKALFSSKQ